MDGNTVAGVKGTELINEDGSINFDVKAGTHGKPSAVFAEGAEDNYKLEIKANGYPDVEATDVGKDYGPDVEIEASAEVACGASFPTKRWAKVSLPLALPKR